MTNHEKWRFYLSGLNSPDSFIDFGFHYLILASLQRRVWFGPDHMPIYPNTFITFVANPGIGKGLVIKKVAEALKFWKMPSPDELLKKPEDKVEREMVEMAAKADYIAGKMEEQRASGSKKEYERPLLVPVAADASSYEALTQAMSKSLRRKNYVEFSQVTGRNHTKIYTHSSLCFCLEEISSLFRKRADDVVNFLLVAYDCGDYKKDTKTQGVDKIQRCCLNFLGGTTPSFMQRTFSDGLLNEGYASRSWMIYEAKNRKDDLFVPDLTPEQEQARMDIYNHIKALTELYGRVRMTAEAEEYLKEWWEKSQRVRANTNERLLHYYSRKNLHTIKLAIAHHFGESTEMLIQKSSCEYAVKTFDKVERKMHFALIKKSENPLYKVTQKIISWLEQVGPKTEVEILAMFYEDLPTNNPREALETILEHQIVIGTIDCDGDTYSVIQQKPEDLDEGEAGAVA